MRRSRWGWLLALALCLGGMCVAQHGQIALVPPSPSPRPQPATTQVMASVTAAPTRMTSAPVPTRIATHTPEVTLMPRTSDSVTLTIVYDNLPFDARLKTAWGFACLIETGQTTVLFDTGGDGPTLMGNLAALGFDPRRIDAVVLSHIHSDHTGGLDALLTVNDLLTVFMPRSFPADFKTRVSKRNPMIQVSEPMTIAEHIRTTGELGTAIVEQALVIETDKGLIVMTGCAHPGIVEMAQKAKSFGDVYLVIGGFHLGDKSAREVETVIAELKRLGVRKVAPSHCTGEKAIEQFKAAFGADFIQAGVGLRVVAPAID
jgi:7,8-dihydropterin-6-yl-methyl-4-(beta-D-ribofuranosyl)aminobenzene 5'-phosphate synthase